MTKEKTLCKLTCILIFMSFFSAKFYCETTNKQKVKFILNVSFHAPFIYYDKCSVLFKYLSGHSLHEVGNLKV